jgi:threonine/homoserine/homoserine lactone efflux protein
MAVAMERGRKAGLTIAAGVLTGSVFWGLMAATGLSAILATSAQALLLLKLLTGGYLLYLAFKAGRSAMTPDEGAATASSNAARTNAARTSAAADPWRLYRQGLLMHLGNPKAVLGWMTIMTLGLGPGASGQTVIIILTAAPSSPRSSSAAMPCSSPRTPWSASTAASNPLT